MRVLVITQYFHPEDFRINDLVVALENGGHKIVVLTAQPNYPSGHFFPGYSAFAPLREFYRGIEVIRVPVYPRGSGRFWNLAFNYLSFALIATLFGLPRLRGRFDACIIFCPSPITAAVPAILYRSLHRTPVAIWVQDLWPNSVLAMTGCYCRRWLEATLGFIVRWIYTNVDQIWIQSPAYRASVKAHGGNAATTAYVPNWADDFYDCERWKEVVPECIPENALVFAGNIGHAQGLDVLLDAAQLTSDTASLHWVFVGDGTARSWLEREVHRRGLSGSITLLPRRPPQEMPKILKAAGALLITLRSEDVFSQTIPSKVQSCLAAGRPIIAVLSGESARIITEARCGFVCPPKDSAALAAAARQLLSMSEKQRSALGRNGHRYYRAHFTRSHVVEMIETLLMQLASRR